jgi:hypothetical protein
MIKASRTKFTYNNSVHSMISISSFFIMYDFYLNAPSSVRDNHSEKEMFITRKKVEEFNNKDKELTKR